MRRSSTDLTAAVRMIVLAACLLHLPIGSTGLVLGQVGERVGFGAPGEAINISAVGVRLDPNFYFKQDDSIGRLVWSSGHSIPGSLSSAQVERLEWETPLFRENISVDFSYLKHIRFPSTAKTTATDQPLRFMMHGGDILYGQLVAIEADYLDVITPRSGNLRLIRSHVNRIQRLNNPSLLYVGPIGPSGWETIRDLREVNEWTSPDQKVMETAKRNAEIFRPLELSARTEFEITLTTTALFGFMISFDSEVGTSIGIETWGDELVVVSGDDYEPLVRLTESNKTLSLQIMLDREKKTLSVFSEAGKLLGSLTGHVSEKARPGFYLRNKGRHLRLKSLRVHKSSGSNPQTSKNFSQRIRLVDGNSVYGVAQRLDADTGNITIKQDDTEQSVPLKQVDSLTLSVDAPADVIPSSESAPEGAPLAELNYSDGGRMTGRIIEIKDGVVTWKAAYSKQPISVKLKDAVRLTNLNSQPPSEASRNLVDELKTSVGVLNGSVHLPEQPTDTIQWKFPGGIKPVSLSANAEAVITRQLNESNLPVDREVFRDQIFLTNSDAFPCVVESIDEEFVYLTSPWTDAKKVSVKHVKAIEFSVSGQAISQGFGANGWKVLSQNQAAVKITDDKLEVLEAVTVGHLSVIKGDQITFDMEWAEGSRPSVLVTMMAEREKRPRGGQEVNIRCKDEAVAVGTSSGITALFTIGDNKIVQCPQRKARVKIVRRGTYLRMSVNDTPVYSTSSGNQNQKENGGLLFTVTGLLQPKIDIKPTPQLTVSNFAVWKSRTKAAHETIDHQIKSQTLTIPRARRKNPSPNVLIAMNGDLLRGRLLSVAGNTITYQSRLEEFRFERNRMAAIVWLHPDVKTSEQAKVESDGSNTDDAPPKSVAPKKVVAIDNRPIVRVVYSKGVNATVRIHQVHAGTIVGESEILGKCRLPIAGGHQLHFGGFGNLVDSFMYADWTSVPAEEPKFASAGDAGTIESAAKKLIGQPAPDFSTKMLDGRAFALGDHKGKVIVLDFWATWCVPCVRAMPAYLEATKHFDPDKFVFIGVNQDEPVGVVEDFQKLRNWKLQIAMDPAAKIAQKYKVVGLPHTVVIGVDGKIVGLHEGYRRGAENELRETIERALQPED